MHCRSGHTVSHEDRHVAVKNGWGEEGNNRKLGQRGKKENGEEEEERGSSRDGDGKGYHQETSTVAARKMSYRDSKKSFHKYFDCKERRGINDHDAHLNMKIVFVLVLHKDGAEIAMLKEIWN